MVQNNQFLGRMNEDQHLKRFIQMCNTVKTNGVPLEYYYLRLFPFSLSDKASRWLNSHAKGTFTTLDKLDEAFLQQYFPPLKTLHFRNKIISFRSMDGETLYEVWERYKELMRMCPHHNLELWQIMDTFYQGIDQGMRTLINQTAGGGLSGVPLEVTYAIVEKATLDFHLWTSDRGNSKDRKGVQDLYLTDGTNDIAELTTTVKMLVAEIKNMKIDSSMKSSVNSNVDVYCMICGSPSHFTDRCPVMGQDNNDENQEDANYLRQYNQGTGFTSGSGMNRWDNPNRNNPNSLISHRIRYHQVSLTDSSRNMVPTSRGISTTTSLNNSRIRARGSTTIIKSAIRCLVKSGIFAEDQERRLVEQERRFQGVEQSIEQLAIQNRMLETQVAQQVNSTDREHGKLPSKLNPNPRASVNAITLQGGKYIKMLPTQATRPPAAKTVEPAPYRPPVPFPQRLAATRRDKAFKQFVDKIRTFYITMPLTDAITQIPTYAKFMKEIRTGKRKIDGTETVALSEECSATMHQPMPHKLPDSGSFYIPCDIGGITICRALCDLGASVSIMPYSLYAKLNLGDLCPTNVTIFLVDHSCRLPGGILKDVPVKVKNIYIPADFVVLEISEDIDIPIILGRPFLYMAKVVIDMDRGSLALRVGSERVIFNLPDMCKSLSLLADCDVLNSADVDDPITLNSVESYRVIPGCPIPIDICAVSTKGAAEAEQTTGSGKEPCKVELKPLIDPGGIYKERMKKWHDK
ncbi:unnamed protein product [Rhodiola kirilowii]